MKWKFWKDRDGPARAGAFWHDIDIKVVFGDGVVDAYEVTVVGTGKKFTLTAVGDRFALDDGRTFKTKVAAINGWWSRYGKEAG